MAMIKIMEIGTDSREEALNLVWKTFRQYEAPDYSAEGVETFYQSAIANEAYLKSIQIYGAYDGDTLLGVIATRNGGNHIALFFVDGAHHRQGIGKALFQTVVENSASDEITVNSSPYAVEVYHRLGFADTAPEQITGGMRYTPMIYRKR
ncbi:putative acetyltransferase [Oscillibacter valericigenes Sjm18-20]|nr:putative acetyltransferase [Oscillibacter valericigenes Sjm18-20]